MLKIFPKYLLLLFFLFSLPVYSADDDSLVIGEFEIEKIVDGDSFRLKGLNKSTRLLGIDTEETYKDKDAAAKSNIVSEKWPEAYDTERKKSSRPVKIESPFGYKTWQWTKELFSDVVKVRLIKEDNDRYIDMFGRYLVYMIAIKKDGSEFNYNIEAVKNGYSPYYAKYGYSKRYHNEFLSAQKYAKKNKSGIWSKKEKNYPDYKERVEWWNRRAEALLSFEKNYKGKYGYFGIYEENEYDRLKDWVGKEVIIFNSISEILKNKEPYLIRTIVTGDKIFDLKVFSENYDIIPEIEKYDGEYVFVKGKLGEYKDRYEIIIEDSDQMWTESEIK